MNKFIKVLIITNGLIIPVFICFLFYKYLAENPFGGTYYESESILVGKELEQAKGDSLVLQGISYEAPQIIYNSTNLYLPISAMTYEEAKDLKKMAQSAGDISFSFFNYFNIIFLDKDYKVIGQLLDKKASITEIFINRGRSDHNETSMDTSIKHITYSMDLKIQTRIAN